MLTWIVVYCDTNHQNFRTATLDANGITDAAREAEDRFGGRGIVRAVVEYENGAMGEWVRALLAGIEKVAVSGTTPS